METYLIKSETTTLKITPEAYHTMIEHGESGFPNEICGFLYGKYSGDEKLITLAKPAENVKEGDQRRRFEIDPRDYQRAEVFALTEGFDFLGLYHTHPNHPAIPSIHDLKQAMPVFSYIILSIQEGKFDHIRSWQIDDQENKFFEENITNLNQNG
ncbi:MAG: M67 family metallopeptidase [Bacteroidetes bacterium]|nr:M67 family metallopeptidase [Bacteroidota bacterium]